MRVMRRAPMRAMAAPMRAMAAPLRAMRAPMRAMRAPMRVMRAPKRVMRKTKAKWMGDNPKVSTGVNKVSTPGKWITDLGAKELKKMSKVPILTNGAKVFEWITNPLELHHGCCPDLRKESADTGEMRALRIVDHQPTWIKVNGFGDDESRNRRLASGRS